MIFFISDLIVTGLVVLFPELSTWLPTVLSKTLLVNGTKAQTFKY